jgi:hypothetical protein
VALASAAAIAVATPAIAPNLTPTPTALSAAQVELTTFADLLSITPADWSDYFFEGWGGAIGPIQVAPQTTEADYWIPDCNYDCTIPGISGLAYLALDALINGNGEGIDNTGGTILENPDLPYQPDPDEPNYNPYINAWGTSALNYFFEGSFSTGLQYIAQSPFAPGAPLANEQIFNAIYLAFQGSYALTTLYLQALSTIAVLASSVPLVGEYVYRGIGSYIGPAFSTVDSVYDYSSYAGIPGILRYVSGVILSGGDPNPYPTAPPEPTAAVSAASVATPVVAALKADAPKAAVEAPQAEAVSSEDGAGSSEAGTEAPVADVEAPTAGDSAEADVSVTESTETPADTTAAVESPSSAVAEAPARTAKRPVRNAVERATKKIASALGGSTSGAATGGAAESGATTGGAAAGGAATGGAAAGGAAAGGAAAGGAAAGGAAAGGAADAGSDSAADSAADSDSADSAS